MILRLVWEQLRSQWRYTAWSAALLAFALALATYAMVTGATALRFTDAYGSFQSKEHYTTFGSVVGPGEVPDWAYVENRVPFKEVQGLIARASTETSVHAFVNGIGKDAADQNSLWVTAATPPPDWDRLLASGDAPEHGEIAISEQAADEFGLAIGDTFKLYVYDNRGPRRYETFTVSGLVKAGTVAPYWSGDPSAAYVPWSDAEQIAVGLPGWRDTDASGTETVIITTGVSWDGDSGTLAPYETAPGEIALPEPFTFGGALGRTTENGPWFLAAAGLAVLGMIVAAFGMGRAQAEARTTWVATARVLGASRRTIAVSSVIETAIVSLAGIALGLVAGIAGVALNLALLRVTHPEALLPAGPSVPRALLVAGVMVGLLIAGVVAAVPAFWTSRVSPVAALKPVTPVGEATVSRNVSVWWLAGILGGGVILWTALFGFHERGEHPGSGVLAAFVWIAGAVIIVAAGALVLEGARVLVVGVGRLLSRSRRPWLISAGDGLAAHRRIFTFASLSALALTAIVSWAATDSATRAIDPRVEFARPGEPPLPGFASWWGGDFGAPAWAAGFGIVIGVVTVVAVAVTLASRATFASDAATRSALGLTGAGERVASATRQWAIMGSAAFIGGLVGWSTRLLVRFAAAALSPREPVYSVHLNLTVAAYGLGATALVIGVALGVTLAGALASGLLTRSGTPVEALRRAAG